MDITPLIFIMIYAVCVAAFFFWYWLISKYISHQRTKWILTGVAVFFTIPVAYYGVIGATMLWIVYEPKRDFDKEDWLADKTHRYQMVDDIIGSRMLYGHDTTTVKALLGEPTLRHDSVWHRQGDNSWEYDMGSGGGGLGFTFHYLNLRFRNDKVDSVYYFHFDD